MSDAVTLAPAKGNARSSGYERQAQDWYREPRRAIDALLDVENFECGIWDPACGAGNIVQAALDRKIPAIGYDIVDRGFPGTHVYDFLGLCSDGGAETNMAIVTNPPFNLAVEFALHALTLTREKVCILQRTTWLEGERRYRTLFSKGHLMRVWQFRSRISMPPGDSDAEPKGGSVSFAWFVFSRAHNGSFTGGWLP